MVTVDRRRESYKALKRSLEGKMEENIRMIAREKIIFALDVSTEEEAVPIIKDIQGYVGTVKIGLELVTALGLVKASSLARRSGAKVFADLKFSDIPNTVAGAIQATEKANIDMLNMHCTAGPDAMRRASEIVASMRPRRLLFGVTILTSISHADLVRMNLAMPPHPKAHKQREELEERGMNQNRTRSERTRYIVWSRRHHLLSS